MKNFSKIISLFMLIAVVSCKDNNEQSNQDVKTKMLTAKAWGHAQVTNTPDGDLSDQYADFAIVFTANASAGFNGTFVVSNGGNAFSEIAGHWRFNDDKTKIIFDSEKEIDFTIDEDHLQLDFIVPDPGAKIVGLSGHFIFDLQPL